LPGGSLATGNARNSAEMPASMLGTSIAKFINKMDPEHIFVSLDYHTPGHSSFVSEANKAKGMMNFPSAAAKEEYGKGIASGRYAGRKFTKKRYWGTETERVDQKLWPEHCVQGTPGAEVAKEFTDALDADKKAKAVMIYKGDTPDIDSYSVVADALGNFTPHNNNKDKESFFNILKFSNINKVYVTGIARDVCVFWSTLDLLNYWILPAYFDSNPLTQKIIKLVFMYNLTRPVSPNPGAPYTDKTPDQIITAVKDLIAVMGTKSGKGPKDFNKIYNDVFELNISNDSPYGYSGTNNAIENNSENNDTEYIRAFVKGRGGSRKMSCKKSHRHTRRCKTRQCRRKHRHTRRC
jgi:nicotinamidase-related amidase